MENKRKLHLEVLRIMAAFFVIFNHTPGFTAFTAHVPESKSYWVFLAFSVLCKISVPLFFMISGALLLGKPQESFKRLLQRVGRIVIALVVFSFVSYLQQVSLGNEAFDLANFFQVLIRSDWLNAYWYLYAYIAFLLCLPFLRAMAQNLKPGHFWYLIGLALAIYGVIPVVFHLILKWDFSYNGNISFGWLLSSIPLYPLIGYFLENKLDIQKWGWRKLALLWLVMLVSIALTCYATYLDNTASGGFTQNYMISFAIVPCMTLYLTAKKLLIDCNIPWLSKLLTCVGGCTFGIYLIHGQLLRAPGIRIFKAVYNSGVLPTILHFLLLSADVLLIGFCITWLLKKIPYVKKLL